ncbi:tetratricopeptide repeat protein [Helicobacter salomonis]|uniref:tetratricopeptide repeat protein n=1 Tax=Helicobacter salomonis TaxID=56878 RepID=UPI000CF1BB7F|nr:SEL1-like repeat protein [Helicobacter salomonis]
MHLKLLMGLLWLGLALLQAMAPTSPYDDLNRAGFNAQKSGYYYQAYRFYKKAQDKGSTAGAANIGDMYFKGLGFAKDYGKAKSYYERALQLYAKDDQSQEGYSGPWGNDEDLAMVHAKYQLALMSAQGLGVPQDAKKAFGLYKDMLSEVLDPACFFPLSVSTCKKERYMTPQEFLDVSIIGNPDEASNALYYLGKAYEEGVIVPKDTKSALGYLRLALYMRGPDVLKQIHHILDLGKQAQEARDYKQAYHFYKYASDQGSVPGEVCLGDLYFFGLGVPRDYKQAYANYKHALDRFFMLNRNSLDFQIHWTDFAYWMNLEGRPDEIWNADGLSAFYASFQLAYMTAQGLGIPKDVAKGFKLYQNVLLYAKRCRFDPKDSHMFPPSGENGWVCFPQNLRPHDFNLPFAKQTHMDIKTLGQALYALAQAYLEGLGTTKDEQQGLEYLKKAVEFGNKEATLALEKWQKPR